MTPEQRVQEISDLTEGFKANRNSIRQLIMKHLREAAAVAVAEANQKFGDPD